MYTCTRKPARKFEIAAKTFDQNKVLEGVSTFMPSHNSKKMRHQAKKEKFCEIHLEDQILKLKMNCDSSNPESKVVVKTEKTPNGKT